MDGWFVVCMSDACAPCVDLVPAEARRQCLIPWNWGHNLLWPFMCLLGSEPRSFARVASSLNLGWVISPTLKKQKPKKPKTKQKTPKNSTNQEQLVLPLCAWVSDCPTGAWASCQWPPYHIIHNFSFILYVWVPACMYVHCIHIRCPWIRITDACERPRGC